VTTLQDSTYVPHHNHAQRIAHVRLRQHAPIGFFWSADVVTTHCTLEDRLSAREVFIDTAVDDFMLSSENPFCTV
jgi:hypothetical protein